MAAILFLLVEVTVLWAVAEGAARKNRSVLGWVCIALFLCNALALVVWLLPERQEAYQ